MQNINTANNCSPIFRRKKIYWVENPKDQAALNKDGKYMFEVHKDSKGNLTKKPVLFRQQSEAFVTNNAEQALRVARHFKPTGKVESMTLLQIVEPKCCRKTSKIKNKAFLIPFNALSANDHHLGLTAQVKALVDQYWSRLDNGGDPLEPCNLRKYHHQQRMLRQQANKQ